MAETFTIYVTRIKEFLKQNEKTSVPYKTLYSKVKGKKGSAADFKKAITSLKDSGEIFETKKGFKLCNMDGKFKAVVSRINKTFGFVKDADGKEIFVPGKFLMGALPNDDVLCEFIESRGELPEAKVIRILSENTSEVTGTIEKDGKTLCLRPDSITKELLIISEFDVPAKEGDKVLAQIIRHGERHSDHRARVIAVFGDSTCAVASAMAILHMNAAPTDFPSYVIDEARNAEHKGIPESEFKARLDLRDEIIFTIDGADTKDIDDAISVKKLSNGWELGVHIADVSFYVKPDTELDRDAFNRGTSIYYANKVIPMLPKELSNGICSLNPDVDRLAFSCIMQLDEDGKLNKYKFSKSIIKSRVKGVYTEINEILAAKENKTEVPSELAEKYDGLLDTIANMNVLASILTANKLRRGAPQIATSECKLIINENDVCVDVQKRDRGQSELIIEEFMLMANTSAAKCAKENNIPFVYRVHEDPSPEKVKELIETVSMMNINVPHFTNIKPKHMAEILEQTKNSPLSPVISSMVLRSMAKAKYLEEPLGHFGLVLEDYAHFTSPIRRYPDLAIHRILTDLCYNKRPANVLQKRYGTFAHDASEQSSQRELAAMRIERECEDCYIAEYMHSHLGEEFIGVVISMQEYGFYVELDNTVEGLVRLDSLANGPYDFDGKFTISKSGKAVYKVGDKVNVRCVGANISAGQVDFIICDNNKDDLV